MTINNVLNVFEKDSSSVGLSTVSLFSGGGGLDLGMESVGFDTLYATDIDEHSCITLSTGKEVSNNMHRNFLQHAIIEQIDANHLEGKYILNKINRKKGSVDLLLGGPPCQAFSVFGKRQGRNDPRGKLVFEYLRILSDIRPKIFVFENVYGLLTVENGSVFEEVCSRLANPQKGLHYELSIHRVNAANYCVPQFRDRVFVIGHIGGKRIESIPELSAENPGPSQVKWRTARDALRGLPKMGTHGIPNHTGRKHSDRIIQRYANLSPGERDSSTRINKLDLDRPSFTIIVGSDKGGGKGHVHPIEPREVTPRESARIQTFPDWWAFSGKCRHPIRQIGNAVPPLLAANIGNAIRENLLGLDRIDFKHVVSALSQEHLFEGDN